MRIIMFRKSLAFIISIFVFCLNSVLFSQEEKEVSKVQENKTNEKPHQFGFTIKRWTYPLF